MKHLGKCNCGKCEVVIASDFDLRVLIPRICDCDFCRSNPSEMVSDPKLVIEIASRNSEIQTNANGSRQETFYHCKSCGQLLAVGATIAGELRGAVNALVLDGPCQFAKPVPVQPRLLSASQKVERWAMIWGNLTISCA